MVRAMARNRTVGRQAAQSRPEASPPANVHAEYKAMLKGDFGDATFRPMDLEDGQPGGAASLFGRPTGLFLIACVAFVVVLCAKLYRDGALDHFWKQEPAAAPIAAGFSVTACAYPTPMWSGTKTKRSNPQRHRPLKMASRPTKRQSWSPNPPGDTGALR
jgi:hypothetical protein